MIVSIVGKSTRTLWLTEVDTVTRSLDFYNFHVIHMNYVVQQRNSNNGSSSNGSSGNGSLFPVISPDKEFIDALETMKDNTAFEYTFKSNQSIVHNSNYRNFHISKCLIALYRGDDGLTEIESDLYFKYARQLQGPGRQRAIDAIENQKMIISKRWHSQLKPSHAVSLFEYVDNLDKALNKLPDNLASVPYRGRGGKKNNSPRMRGFPANKEKTGTKKKGTDGKLYIVQEQSNGVKKWKMCKKNK